MLKSTQKYIENLIRNNKKGVDFMIYFKNIKTIQELKKQYRDLIMQYHPDLNNENTTKIMQEINSQYDMLFSKVKNSFVNSKGIIYEKQNSENLEDFKNIINKIITFKDCKIEIIGNWIWVSGNTKYYKDILKSLKFNWINNKKAWAFHQDKYFKKSKKVYSLQDLRDSFLTINVEIKETEKL